MVRGSADGVKPVVPLKVTELKFVGSDPAMVQAEFEQ